MANKTITQLDTAQSLNDDMVIAVDNSTTEKVSLGNLKSYINDGNPSGIDLSKCLLMYTDASDSNTLILSSWHCEPQIILPNPNAGE